MAVSWVIEIARIDFVKALDAFFQFRASSFRPDLSRPFATRLLMPWPMRLRPTSRPSAACLVPRAGDQAHPPGPGRCPPVSRRDRKRAWLGGFSLRALRSSSAMIEAYQPAALTVSDTNRATRAAASSWGRWPTLESLLRRHGRNCLRMVGGDDHVFAPDDDAARTLICLERVADGKQLCRAGETAPARRCWAADRPVPSLAARSP